MKTVWLEWMRSSQDLESSDVLPIAFHLCNLHSCYDFYLCTNQQELSSLKVCDRCLLFIPNADYNVWQYPTLSCWWYLYNILWSGTGQFGMGLKTCNHFLPHHETLTPLVWWYNKCSSQCRTRYTVAEWCKALIWWKLAPIVQICSKNTDGLTPSAGFLQDLVSHLIPQSA